ncbi:glycosyltransferase family 25 protein [Photobacterium carnosum]|uniref:glycosyltransferase family 25 protein n=1 Tax=Photobacterium carnosum TaxID=2023717 RepID=UPI001C8FCAC0|nr:glycosyltransferase family 25 protein [Photobacterium carnosum]MBY3790481.1 glycosyltransferase family 25 protein [Photobacterium carnosum]MCD9535524.1 hypothetical protein [Photobacterium carnosum]
MKKVYVISLFDSKRRYNIKKQFESINFNNYEFIDAFDARRLNVNELDLIFNIKKFIDKYGRKPAKGEIGCTISHVSLWNKICKENEDDIIIIEDDAIISDRFLDFVKCDSNSDLIILGYSKISWLASFYHYIKKPIYNKSKYGSYNIGDIKKEFSCGTVGYYLNNKAAGVLKDIFSTELPFILADDWMFYSKYQKIKHTRPFIIYEDFKQLESTIENERELKLKESFKHD